MCARREAMYYRSMPTVQMRCRCVFCVTYFKNLSPGEAGGTSPPSPQGEGCASEKTDIEACEPYFTQYFGQVDQWTEKHSLPPRSQYARVRNGCGTFAELPTSCLKLDGIAQRHQNLMVRHDLDNTEPLQGCNLVKEIPGVKDLCCQRLSRTCLEHVPDILS